MLKFFKNPFAIIGARAPVSATDPGTGEVNYPTGYPAPYQLPKTDPLSRNIERDKMNQLFFDTQQAIAELQARGTPDFITTVLNEGVPFEYGIGDRVRYDDGVNGLRVFVSRVAANVDLPTVAASWAPARDFDPAAVAGGTANALTATLSPSLGLMPAGTVFYLRHAAANTGPATLALNGGAAKAIVCLNDVALVDSSIPGAGSWGQYVYDLTLDKYVLLNPNPNNVLRGYLDGLALSTVGVSATLTVAPGQAANSTAAVLMALTGALSKTTAAWAVGNANGGLDTGAIANNTWYHWFLIRRPDTKVVDVLFSLSPTAPTLPANYTQFRRIGSRRTNAAAQWLVVFQDGDEQQWDTVAALDFSGASSTVAANVTTFVPTGIKVKAVLNLQTTAGGAQNQVLVSDPDITNSAPSTAAWPLAGSSADINTAIGSNQIFCRTNTAAQVRVRSTQNDGTVRVATLGWIDSRGRDA